MSYGAVHDIVLRNRFLIKNFSGWNNEWIGTIYIYAHNITLK